MSFIRQSRPRPRRAAPLITYRGIRADPAVASVRNGLTFGLRGSF